MEPVFWNGIQESFPCHDRQSALVPHREPCSAGREERTRASNL